jgi:hypothetical protein
MTRMQTWLQELIEEAMASEPTRVVTELTKGGGVYAQAKWQADQKGIDYDLIFVRKDGWTLACRYEWRPETEALWEDEWIALIDVRTGSTAWKDDAGRWH